MTRAAHELAGLLTAGGYGRPLRALEWRVPADVELDGDVIRWNDGRKPGTTKARARFLDRFLTLSTAPDERVAAFVSAYGPMHRPVTGSIGNFSIPATSGEEKVDNWRQLSTEARTVLDLAAKVRNPRQVVEPSDFAPLSSLKVRQRTSLVNGRRLFSVTIGPSSVPALGDGGIGPELLDAKEVLSGYLSTWLATVRTGFRWDHSREAEVFLSPGGVVGALGLQLAQSIAGTKGLALTCDNEKCGVSFSPHDGRQRYCSTTCAATARQRRKRANHRASAA